MKELEVGDIVPCTVERITGTIVFVEIEGGQKGGITFSEVSPGRIRNIRDVIKMGQTIRVKVISIDEDNKIRLSKKALEEPSRPSYGDNRSTSSEPSSDDGRNDRNRF